MTAAAAAIMSTQKNRPKKTAVPFNASSPAFSGVTSPARRGGPDGTAAASSSTSRNRLTSRKPSQGTPQTGGPIGVIQSPAAQMSGNRSRKKNTKTAASPASSLRRVEASTA